MGKVIRSAMGRMIDIDRLAATNERVIAVGNMKVNSRGDELGPGGVIVKTRDQVMKEYYALNTPVAADPIVDPTPAPIAKPINIPPARPAQQFIPPVAPPVPAPEPEIFNPNSGMEEVDDGPTSVTITSDAVNELAALGIDANKEVAQGIEISKQPQPQPAQPVVPTPKPPVVNATPPPPPPIPQGVAKPFPPRVEEPKIRGSLANSVAKGATVTQTPMQNPNKAKGVQRF